MCLTFISVFAFGPPLPQHHPLFSSLETNICKSEMNLKVCLHIFFNHLRLKLFFVCLFCFLRGNIFFSQKTRKKQDHNVSLSQTVSEFHSISDNIKKQSVHQSGFPYLPHLCCPPYQLLELLSKRASCKTFAISHASGM